MIEVDLRWEVSTSVLQNLESVLPAGGQVPPQVEYVRGIGPTESDEMEILLINERKVESILDSSMGRNFQGRSLILSGLVHTNNVEKLAGMITDAKKY